MRNGVDLSRYAPRERDREQPVAVRLDGKFVISYVGTTAWRTISAGCSTLPMQPKEAMAMGLPILLVAPEGEASRIIAEDGARLWCPAGDPAALAAASRQLMNDDALRGALAARSRSAAQTHSRERQAELVLACLSDIIDHSTEKPVKSPAG